MTDSTDDFDNWSAMIEIEEELWRERLSREIWITKDGLEIKFEDLADNHLNNIIRHFQNREEHYIQDTILELREEVKLRKND